MKDQLLKRLLMSLRLKTLLSKTYKYNANYIIFNGLYNFG